MTNANDFTDILDKPRRRFILKLPSLTIPVLIIVLGVLLTAGFRYSSACFQALLKHQVEMVKAQNKPFVELAKRVGDE